MVLPYLVLPLARPSATTRVMRTGSGDPGWLCRGGVKLVGGATGQRRGRKTAVGTERFHVVLEFIALVVRKARTDGERDRNLERATATACGLLIAASCSLCILQSECGRHSRSLALTHNPRQRCAAGRAHSFPHAMQYTPACDPSMQAISELRSQEPGRSGVATGTTTQLWLSDCSSSLRQMHPGGRTFICLRLRDVLPGAQIETTPDCVLDSRTRLLEPGFQPPCSSVAGILAVRCTSQAWPSTEPACSTPGSLHASLVVTGHPPLLRSPSDPPSHSLPDLLTDAHALV